MSEPEPEASLDMAGKTGLSTHSVSAGVGDSGAPDDSKPRRKGHPLFVEFETVPEVVNFRDFFGNDRPVELEVGSGKGLFLRNAAAAEPGHNFLGIEIVRKYAYFGAERIARLGLTNIRIVPGDALAFLKRVPASSVQSVHLYFPDPWWKKRHHKRRVFTSEFVKDVARILADDGRLLIVTDVADYFRMVQEIMREFDIFVEDEPPEENQPRHDMDYLTNFERKFRREGRPIYRTAYTRIARSAQLKPGESPEIR